MFATVSTSTSPPWSLCPVQWSTRQFPQPSLPRNPNSHGHHSPRKGMATRLPERCLSVSWRFPNRAVFLVCLAGLLAVPTVRADVPDWLPRYDLDVKIDVEGQCVVVKEQVRWTNP